MNNTPIWRVLRRQKKEIENMKKLFALTVVAVVLLGAIFVAVSAKADVTICHATGNPHQPWLEKNVSWQGWENGHRDQHSYNGVFDFLVDSQHPCPPEADDGDSSHNTQTPQPQGGATTTPQPLDTPQPQETTVISPPDPGPLLTPTPTGTIGDPFFEMRLWMPLVVRRIYAPCNIHPCQNPDGTWPDPN